MYIPPRDSTSTHYKTADTDIQQCIQYITNMPHSVLSNSDHITLNTNKSTIVPNTTQQQHCTAHGNAPKGLGPYLRPKTHIQHTDSQHLSTSTQATTNNNKTLNRMG